MSEQKSEYQWCVQASNKPCINGEALEKILRRGKSDQLTQTVNELCKTCRHFRRPQRPPAPEVVDVLSIIRDYGFIAGSCARYYASLMKDEPMYSDIDVFCYSTMSFDRILSRLEGHGWHYKGESPNAIQCTKVFNGIEAIVEVIKPFKNDWMQTYGDPSIVVEQFDFPCVKAWFLSEEWLFIDDQFDQDTKDRRLHITHINCPVAVAQRVAKYAQKGYSIGIRELMKLFLEWERRPTEYRQRLLELLHRTEGLTEEEFLELERMLRVD